MLFIIICVAIFIFSKVTNRREGFSDDKKDLDDYDGSYTAPAGNTVLFDKPRKDNNSCKDKKNNKNKKRYNSEFDANDEPLGIPRNQIPDGNEDMYILKSEVIPPVCPACPNVTACPNNGNSNGNSNSNSNGNSNSNSNSNSNGNSKGNAPPPCPPCARCPEPAFDCKKVPNYNSNNSEYLPRPVLADFSQFGM
jgi:hypothetical protein